jgi:hypothetical protein
MISDTLSPTLTMPSWVTDCTNVERDTFRSLLASSYATDKEQFVCNLFASGDNVVGENKNHGAYMIGLAWLWQKDPKVFMTSAAHLIGDNSSYIDLLTLLSVITKNRSYPVEVLSFGEAARTSMDAQRASLRLKEHEIWQKLLTFFDVTSNDVVQSQIPSRTNRISTRCTYVTPPATFRREETTTGYLSPYVSSTPATPSTPVTPTACCVHTTVVFNGNRSTYVFGSTRVAGTQGRPTPLKKKNIWLNEAFKTRWQLERAKLHHRNYEAPFGVEGSTEDYATLVDFVVTQFANGITSNNPLIAKWAPLPGGSHDQSTKGVLAFKGGYGCKVPVDWGSSVGISLAIAYKLYGGVLVQRMVDDATSGAAVLSVSAQKMFVTTLYKDKLSEICGGV